MARPLRIEFAGALYHITARGNAKQDIFADDQDRRSFLRYLAKANERYHWLCHAYCLMNNHYHLLMETQWPTLSTGMQYLNGTYTQSYNRRHDRVGHLFQGRFKAILVDKDSYLLELARYIVLNPVRARKVGTAKEWPWSSYKCTAGFSETPKWLTTDWILAWFDRKKAAAEQTYRHFISQAKEQISPWKQLRNQVYLGSEQFIQDMQGKMNPDQSLDDIPKPQIQRPAKPLIFYVRKYKVRNKIMAEAYRSGQYTLKAIGEHFGVSHATVSRAVKQFDI